jgi:hypothetical protein
MTVYKYFTKDSLIEAAKAGNIRGYNRQLDPEKLTDLKWEKFLPVTFHMPHEHIAGELVEPHVRVMVMIDANPDKSDDEKVILDISQERFDALPTYDPDRVAYEADEAGEGGQHRTRVRGRRR